MKLLFENLCDPEEEHVEMTFHQIFRPDQHGGNQIPVLLKSVKIKIERERENVKY